MRFGIVGAGVIGQLRAQSIKEHPSTELVAVLKDPAVQKQLVEAGSDPAPSTPAEMGAQVQREIALTSRLIKAANIKVE